MMKSSEIRHAFLDYFTQRGHQMVESSSLIPGNDPTLLFTNAGMVQFKDTFLGIEPRPYTRATTSQCCVRAGGKHNDLENVGYTARHHTFFEMLGNFSFGDYFKREAIAYAWEFLTKILKLPEDRLWVTVFQDDDETADIWLKEMKISPARFSRCGEKDNFWAMGDTGPCGPCTEIFYDHGSDIPGGPPGSPEEDGDRYIEIWNLVFMQFNRDKHGQLHPLPKPSVDTGMGLERIAAVVQGVHNNYHIDSFQHIIQAIARLTKQVDLEHPSLKVIADHIRACGFLIADGVLPSNEGRGYVLRRIIRRAIRHGHKLGMVSPFFYTLVKPLDEVMGDAYPGLHDKKNQIERILVQEENQFSKTLDQGLGLLQSEIKQLATAEIPGEIVFKLYDTYGFPVDLTADVAREQHLTVDMQGFDACMQRQRELSQSSSQFDLDYTQSMQLSETSQFHGYEREHMPCTVLAVLQNGQRVEGLKTGDMGSIVLDHTPFYAESGGQVGDKGRLISGDMEFQVEDTQKIGQALVHHGVVVAGEFKTALHVVAEVDSTRRAAIRLNHTATHLLHAALKLTLGAHVQQKGSLVDADRARFDFSHGEALSKKELLQLETLVNDQIRANFEVTTNLMDLNDAKKSGAMALFGEKYADKVRVLSIGEFSKELCGGTHAKHTGDIGLFKIVAEYGIASGVRRIELVTGQHALLWVNQQQDILLELSDKLKTTPLALIEKLTQFMQETKQQEKELDRLKNKMASLSGQSLLQEAQTLGEIQLLVKQLETEDTQALRNTLDQLKSNLPMSVIVLYTLHQGKMNVIAGVSKALIGKVPPASALVRHLCGKGGGRDDMAQGGGEIPADLDAKLKQISEIVMTDKKRGV